MGTDIGIIIFFIVLLIIIIPKLIFCIYGSWEIAPGSLPQNIDIIQWRKKSNFIRFLPDAIIVTPLLLIYLSSTILDEKNIMLSVFIFTVSFVFLFVLIFFLESIIEDPYHKRLKSMVITKLLENELQQSVLNTGFFAGLYPSDRISGVIEDIDDLGFLVIEGETVTYYGMRYRIEIDRNRIKGIYQFKKWGDTLALWDVKFVGIKYTEPDGQGKKLEIAARDGITALAYRSANVQLYQYLKNWYEDIKNRPLLTEQNPLLRDTPDYELTIGTSQYFTLKRITFDSLIFGFSFAFLFVSGIALAAFFKSVLILIIILVLCILLIYFIPFVENLGMRKIIQKINPANTSSGQIYQITCIPRIVRGLRALSEDADDVGILNLGENSLLFSGDCINLRLPYSEIVSIRTRKAILYGGQRVILKIKQSGEITGFEFHERFSRNNSQSKKIDNTLEKLLKEKTDHLKIPSSNTYAIASRIDHKYEVKCPSCAKRVILHYPISPRIIILAIIVLLKCLFHPITTIRAIFKNTWAYNGRCPTCGACVAICPSCSAYWKVKLSMDVPCPNCGLRLK